MRATVALDPAAAEVGDAVLIIQADRTELERISVTGTQVAPLDIELGACQQLTLNIESGDSPTGDIVNLGDARFSK